MDKDLPVSVWPEWKIIEKIGEGSFGSVYRAQRCERGKTFYSAIKIITIPGSRNEWNSVRAEVGSDQAAREYFQNLVGECIQEVGTMEYFRGNSHIVSVEDFKVVEYLDENSWDISIRMEFLTSFMDYCEGKNLTEDEVIQLGIDLSKAIGYCGKLKIIHRDIKPENIFVSRFGDFKLGDFGIARELERTMSSLSKKGTYSYMAPEMYRGEQYDGRVDIYSLGIVLYKLMNHNRLPFLSLEKQLITYRDKENALARRMSGEALAKPVDAGDDFARIIRKACAYDPEERYQTPQEMIRELENLKFVRETIGPAEAMVPHNPEIKNTPAARPVVPPAHKSGAAGGQRVQPKAESVNVHARKQVKPGTHETQTQPHTPEPEKPDRSAGTPQPQREPAKPARTTRTRLSVRHSRRKRRTLSPWAVSFLVILCSALVIITVYMKLMLDEYRHQKYGQEIMQVLEKNDYSTAQIDDFSTAIQMVKDQATTIVNGLAECKEEGKEGERLRYYGPDGKLQKSLVYPALSKDGLFEEYYYWDEQLFFAYIWESDKKADLYYYNNGKLIRWIDRKGELHDEETENPEYTQRGEKYWNLSVEQLAD